MIAKAVVVLAPTTMIGKPLSIASEKALLTIAVVLTIGAYVSVL